MIYSIIEIILVILSTVSAIFLFSVNRKYIKKIKELKDENETLKTNNKECYDKISELMWKLYSVEKYNGVIQKDFGDLYVNHKNLINENRRLESLAYIDTLTGCLNRNALERDRKTIESDKNVVVIVDINDLKDVNDKQGHEAGDKVIVSVANDLRRFGTVYRLGGDEFLIIIESRNNFCKFIEYGKTQKKFSYGITERRLSYLTENFEPNLSAAMSEADKEMYKCKKEMKRRNKCFKKK